MSALPVLRLILRPEPGFGLDARLPMGQHMRCYLAAEAYIHGGSVVNFGLEPSHFPFLRLQLAPSTKLSLRLPLLPLTEFKSLHAGASLTLYNAGDFPRLPRRAAPDVVWKAVRRFVAPALELQHRNTVLGTLLDGEQRKALRGALREVHIRRGEREARRRAERKEAVRGFEPPGMPPLDPRKRGDPIDMLRERFRERYGEDGAVRRGGRRVVPPGRGANGGGGRGRMGSGAGQGVEGEREPRGEGNAGFCGPPSVRRRGAVWWRLGKFGRRRKE